MFNIFTMSISFKKCLDTVLKYRPAIYMTITCIIASAVGGVGGWFIGNYFKPVVLTQGEEITINSEAYDKYVEITEGKNVNEIDFTSEDLTLADVANIAWYKFSYVNENSTLYSLCRADSMGINVQYTLTSWQKRENKVFKEATSQSGFVYFGDRTYNYNVESDGDAYLNQLDTYHVIGEDNVSINTETFASQINYGNAKESKRTEESYVTRFALNAKYPCNYLFNDESIVLEESKRYTSVLDQSQFTYKSEFLRNSDGTYTLNLLMNSVATESYARFMMTTTEDFALAKMNTAPEFKNVGMSLNLDASLNMIDGRIDEDYVVNAALAKADTNASSRLVFDYNLKSDLPSLEEQVDYTLLAGTLEK